MCQSANNKQIFSTMHGLTSNDKWNDKNILHQATYFKISVLKCVQFKPSATLRYSRQKHQNGGLKLHSRVQQGSIAVSSVIPLRDINEALPDTSQPSRKIQTYTIICVDRIDRYYNNHLRCWQRSCKQFPIVVEKIIYSLLWHDFSTAVQRPSVCLLYIREIIYTSFQFI